MWAARGIEGGGCVGGNACHRLARVGGGWARRAGAGGRGARAMGFAWKALAGRARRLTDDVFATS